MISGIDNTDNDNGDNNALVVSSNSPNRYDSLGITYKIDVSVSYVSHENHPKNLNVFVGTGPTKHNQDAATCCPTTPCRVHLHDTQGPNAIDNNHKPIGLTVAIGHTNIYYATSSQDGSKIPKRDFIDYFTYDSARANDANNKWSVKSIMAVNRCTLWQHTHADTKEVQMIFHIDIIDGVVIDLTPQEVQFLYETVKKYCVPATSTMMTHCMAGMHRSVFIALLTKALFDSNIREIFNTDTSTSCKTIPSQQQLIDAIKQNTTIHTTNSNQIGNADFEPWLYIAAIRVLSNELWPDEYNNQVIFTESYLKLATLLQQWKFHFKHDVTSYRKELAEANNLTKLLLLIENIIKSENAAQYPERIISGMQNLQKDIAACYQSLPTESRFVLGAMEETPTLSNAVALQTTAPVAEVAAVTATTEAVETILATAQQSASALKYSAGGSSSLNIIDNYRQNATPVPTQAELLAQHSPVISTPAEYAPDEHADEEAAREAFRQTLLTEDFYAEALASSGSSPASAMSPSSAVSTSSKDNVSGSDPDDQDDYGLDDWELIDDGASRSAP